MTSAMGGGVEAAIGGRHGKRAAMRRQGDGAGQVVGIAVEAVRRQWQVSQGLLVRGLIINPQANADAHLRTVQTPTLTLTLTLFLAKPTAIVVKWFGIPRDGGENADESIALTWLNNVPPSQQHERPLVFVS